MASRHTFVSLLHWLSMSLVGGCATTPQSALLPVAPSARYVAMGSSFAAGPGVTVSADSPATRCTRSRDNYARQLARMRQLDLVDVSCGGATTAHLLGPWRELPPQMDALTSETALVTITIGGNDIGYVGKLFIASCRGAAALPTAAQTDAMCKAITGRAPDASMATDAAWATLAGRLDEIAAEVRRRAPRARLIFVDYVTLVPDGLSCPQVPLLPDDAAAARATAKQLAQVTEDAARRAGAGLVKASALSRGHDACAATPWATGFVARDGSKMSAPYHPNLAAMTGIADALDQMLKR